MRRTPGMERATSSESSCVERLRTSPLRRARSPWTSTVIPRASEPSFSSRARRTWPARAASATSGPRSTGVRGPAVPAQAARNRRVRGRARRTEEIAVLTMREF